jgi:uncharacterized Zn-finger protein
MPTPLAYFGVSNSGVNLFINLLLLTLVIVWFSLIYWTRADARRRLDDPVLVNLATVASCFPFVGTVIYMIVRPPEYLEDIREREIEVQASEARLAQFSDTACPYCGAPVDRDFVVCPACQSRLRELCTSCSRPLDLSWTVCPYCAASVEHSRATSRLSSETRAHGLPPAG